GRTITINDETHTLPPARVMAQFLAGFMGNRATDMSRRMTLDGSQFGGNRDMYRVLGYKRELEFHHYMTKYLRQDVAARVIESAPEDTWRDSPEILEGKGDQAKDDTPFVTAVNQALEGLGAWAELENVDTVSGIGRYGVLLVGFDDNQPLKMPVEPSAKPVYLRSYDEGQATIETWEENESSPRFGLPLMYKTTAANAAKADVLVHYSRVILVAERTRLSRVMGLPRMERVYNRLDDLEKVIGGGAEAFWKLVYQGLILSAKEGFDFSETSGDDLESAVSNYMNDIYRFLILDGYEAQPLGGQSVTPAEMVDALISLIAAATGIPKRLLIGAELGHVASTQDAANWAGRIASRRTRHAEPVLLRPLINLLAFHQVVQLPSVGYSFKWQPLFELDAVQKAQVGYIQAQTLNVASGGMPQTMADPSEVREMAGLPGAMPAGIMQPPEGADTERLTSNILVIRHIAERIPATTDPLPFLQYINIGDGDITAAIEAFEEQFPQFKGVLEAGLQ
ncbi:DUF1073 domain-containing protein, partial [Staphylococcus aureus]|uniref:anti-CBASS protein Acb1 family protein n=1 Tax=Staphylococcus aureus TaxID=1280 RepID=UPI0023B05550